MSFYLAVVQTLVLWALMVADSARSRKFVVAVQMVLLCGMYLSWGGYSTDSWRYLWRFGEDPFVLWFDRIFWILGYFLHKMVESPWSLKILSVASCSILVLALVLHHRRHSWQRVSVSLFLLPLLPVYFMGFGNVVRQAMAGSLVLLAMALFQSGFRKTFLVMILVSLGVHAPVVAIMVTVVLAYWWPRFAPVFLVGGVILGVVGHLGLEFLLFDISAVVPYATTSDGSYHYLKYSIHLCVVSLILFDAYRLRNRPFTSFESAYIYSVGLASLLIVYEVPFDRLLLNSELFLPFLLPGLLNLESQRRIYVIGIWLVSLMAGWMLWNHRSVLLTLGIET